MNSVASTAGSGNRASPGSRLARSPNLLAGRCSLGTFRVLLWVAAGLCFANSHGQVLTQIGRNFTGSTAFVDSFFTPPDCNGAAGPGQFVELINGRFTVYSKATGARLLSETDQDFWTAAGLSLPSGVFISDPRLVFDPTVQRWFVGAIDYDASGVNNRFLLAVSTAADPLAPWQALAFTADPVNGNFADFPTLGLDANGVYLAAFMFDSAGVALGDTLVAVPKGDLIGPTPTADSRTWFGLLDSSRFGCVLQPVVNFDTLPTNANVLAVGDLGLDFLPHSNLVACAVQNASTPARASLSTPTSISVDPYLVPVNPQQPGDRNLDPGDTRFSSKVSQVGGIIYAVHSLEVNDREAIRWYRISPTDYSVLESGTITDPNLDLFYPSIAANASGTVVIAFNASGPATYISIFAVVGQTVNGVTSFGPPLLLKSGLATYQYTSNSGISRWGDYSTTSVDPTDPNRFWTIQMFPVSLSVWATQITELLTAVPILSITSLHRDVLLSWPGTAIPFELQSTRDLANPNWLKVNLPYSSTNGVISVQAPASGAAQFFRLHQL